MSDHIAKVHSPNCAADNKSLFYVAEDAAKRPYRLYRHILGGKDDELVYDEKDELFRLSARRTLDKQYLMITSSSSTTSEVRYLPSARPLDEFRVVLPREADHEYHVDHR